MINIFTNKYVKESYNTICNWIFPKEIDRYWEFKVTSRSYILQFFIMHISPLMVLMMILKYIKMEKHLDLHFQHL